MTAPRRLRQTAWPITVVIAVLVAMLAACAIGAAPAASPGGQPVDEQAGSADRDARGPLFGSGEDAPPEAQIADRRIIKTGELTVRVDEVGVAIGKVRALATELDGFVSGSQSSGEDDYATLTLRVPAETFDVALARLRELAIEVVAEATREEDVTTTVIDLEARIANLEASEQQYRELIDRATTVEDILAVQRRLDEVRGEIEQMTTQLEHLNRQAAMSTLTVTLVPPDRPVDAVTMSFDPGATFDQALAALVGIGQAVVSAAIWFAIVWLPLLLVLAVLALIGRRVFTGVRRRMPSAQKPPVA
jgi:hypothetical protein